MDGFKQHLYLVQLLLLLRLGLVQLSGAGTGFDLQIDAQLLSNLRKFSRNDLTQLPNDLGRVLILDKRGDGLHISISTC